MKIKKKYLCVLEILCLFRTRVLFLIMLTIVHMIKFWAELFSDRLGSIEIKTMFTIKKLHTPF